MHLSFILSILAIAYETYGQMIVPGSNTWDKTCNLEALKSPAIDETIYMGCVEAIVRSCYQNPSSADCASYWRQLYTAANMKDIYDVCAQWEPSTYNADACKHKVVTACLIPGRDTFAKVRLCELQIASASLITPPGRCYVACKSYLYLLGGKCPYGYAGTC